jgi:hypothetical protein
MSDGLDKLPSDLKQTILSFLREKDDGFEVVDMLGLVNFIVEHGTTYPVLYTLVKINEEAVVEHYKYTGEVPPGIKLVHKTQESNKVTVIAKGGVAVKYSSHGPGASTAGRRWRCLPSAANIGRHNDRTTDKI